MLHDIVLFLWGMMFGCILGFLIDYLDGKGER
jgi:hypothetical protein